MTGVAGAPANFGIEGAGPGGGDDKCAEMIRRRT
jgi:hypothetical protein